jgi:hypothetical protein
MLSDTCIIVTTRETWRRREHHHSLPQLLLRQTPDWWLLPLDQYTSLVGIKDKKLTGASKPPKII